MVYSRTNFITLAVEPGLCQVYCVAVSRHRFAEAFSCEKREDVDLCWQQGCGCILKHATPASGTQSGGIRFACRLKSRESQNIIRFRYFTRDTMYAQCRNLCSSETRDHLIFERPEKPLFAEHSHFPPPRTRRIKRYVYDEILSKASACRSIIVEHSKT